MNIISFSLWGDNPKYTIGAVRNSELAKRVYPGWMTRFYVGSDVPENIIDSLIINSAEVILMEDEANWNGMFWRFFAADSEDVVIFRDTDSRLGLREKAAVDAWLNSDRDFHIMRDHPYHKFAILGGMWGVRGGILKGIKDSISNYEKGLFDNKYQVDQNFLKDVVYPIVVDESMVHDEYFANMPFPTKRINAQDFVGQVYDENEVPQF